MSGEAKPGLVGPYVSTLALLATHEIDSAYWHEWELFRLPGDISGFLLANLFLVLVFLYGLVCVVQRGRAAVVFGVALAVSGVLAFGIHSWFLSQGRPEFRSFGSVGVLAATLLSSVWLGWATWRLRLDGRPDSNGRVG